MTVVPSLRWLNERTAVHGLTDFAFAEVEGTRSVCMSGSLLPTTVLTCVSVACVQRVFFLRGDLRGEEFDKEFWKPRVNEAWMELQMLANTTACFSYINHP